MGKEKDSVANWVFVCLVVMAIILVSVIIGGCSKSGDSDTCEWEQKKQKSSASQEMSRTTGGSGGRGGGSSTTGGSGGKTVKVAPNTSGGTGGVKYTKKNPPPKPVIVPSVGMVWVLDCD